MRISDWSSDVCSSDLDEHQLRGSSLLGTPTMRTGDMAMNDAGSLLRAKTGRDALLAAAASIFFEQGYEATRIDDIIERAGGSKRNIYEEFGSKEGLFAAIVTERAERALSALAMDRSEEHTSELQSLMRISYAVFCLKKKNTYRTKNMSY